MSPRRAARVDKNQKKIVDALRAVGASVTHLHAVGQGCPDILVGYRGVNYLLEIKRGKGRLTPDQGEWHQAWRGSVAIVRSVDAALVEIGAKEGA